MCYIVISLLVPGSEEDECYEVEYQTVFECSNIVNEDFLKSEFARISAPAIGLSIRSGFYKHYINAGRITTCNFAINQFRTIQ